MLFNELHSVPSIAYSAPMLMCSDRSGLLLYGTLRSMEVMEDCIKHDFHCHQSFAPVLQAQMFGIYVKQAEVDCIPRLVKELMARVSNAEKAKSTLTSWYDSLC